MPVEAGALLAPVAVRTDDSTYLALELVVEDDAYDPAGDPFTPEEGDYVLELLRAESVETGGAEEAQAASEEEDRDDPVRLNDAELPVLLVVVAGEVELTVDDEDSEELRAGSVVAVDDDFDLRWLGEEPGIVLAAVLRLSEENDDEAIDDESDVRPATTRSGETRQDGGTNGDDESDPTPTPGPTEEADGNSDGNPPPGAPPTDDQGPAGRRLRRGRCRGGAKRRRRDVSTAPRPTTTSSTTASLAIPVCWQTAAAIPTATA